MTSAARPVLVIGGGLAGLAAAHALHRARVPVTLLEASDAVGGAVGTVQVGGHLFEQGPIGLVRRRGAAVARLVAELQLGDRVVAAHPCADRWLLWDDAYVEELPEGLLGLVTAGRVPWSHKLRLLRALAARSGRPLGLWDGSPRRRALAATLAGLVDPLAVELLMAQIGGCAHGGAASRGPRGASARRWQMDWLAGGMGALVHALHRELGTRVRLQHDVLAIDRGASGGWHVIAIGAGHHVSYDAERLVLAVPPWLAADFVTPLDAHLGGLLGRVRTVDVGAVGLGYRRADIGASLDALGVLLSPRAKPEGAEGVLGIVFASSVFPEMAPPDHVTLLVLLACEPLEPGAELGGGQLVERACAAVASVLGARGVPTAVSVTCTPRALVPAADAYAAWVSDIHAASRRVPGLFLASEVLGGCGIEGAAASGLAVADALLR